jgi:hypothetical protein
MAKQESILEHIALPTRIIVQRIDLSVTTLAEIVQRGELALEGGETCELEAGGQVLARGKIVRRRGEHYFKVLETGEEKSI